MRPPLEFLMPPEIGAELIYSFVIIACSLMVYYGTKELYELSSYKGIKYFRQAFLFFAIAYFFRYSIRFILSFFNIRTMHEFLPMSLGPMGPLTLFLFMYFSSMAVFYLLYSVMWKRWNGNPKMIYIFHAIAVVISLVSIISRRNDILLGINFILLILISFVYYMAHKDSKTKKKGHNLYAIYMLLFVFWILNIIDLLVPSFLQQFQLIIYLASSGIFLTILYRVLKKVGINKMVKRGKLEIMKDILKIIQENRNSIKPTPLLRKSKLSSLRFKEYYLELIEKDLVKEITDTDEDKFIILTEKGFKFLEKYKTIINFIDEFEL